MKKAQIRIMLADDHMLMRMGLSTLIDCEEDMKIVGEAKNGRQAVELAHALKPDIVIMDLMMPELSGAEATKLIHDAYPEIKIMVLTSFATSKEMSDAIMNGADGALMKDTAADELIGTIRDIVAGKRLIPERLMRQAAEDNITPKLSDRHLEILSSVAQGQSNSDIAKQYGLSEITIKKQLSTIFARLGVSNRSEAVALALRKQILKS
ncbi:MAG: response regulator transcription factor [Kiritimatiellae bacterium]|nr:response regulator transcription factor [Kiritimatiellia bacterium]